nr:TonB family protein [uncultured Sulfurimonas sp.]
MIRHSSSFIFSLVFHGALLVALLFAWKNIPSVEKVKHEKVVRVELCNVVVEKPVVKPPEKPKPKPIPKPKPKPKPIVKKIQKPKQKTIVKKVEVVKEIPVVKPDVIEEPIVKEVKKEEKIVEQEPVETMEVFEEKVVEQEVYVEDAATKQVRLEQEYLQEHIAKIAKLLKENLYYPRRARKSSIEGEVMVKFTLSKDAKAHSIVVLSSKSKILSRAAIKTIEDLSGKFPKPKQELILHVPINYSLNM